MNQIMIIKITKVTDQAKIKVLKIINKNNRDILKNN